ncbi:hypothetical protein EQ718_16910 (plasmid) [Paracoccus versutus]|nr:hypothetical protein EQ718_16910 [Paracoccus versutus]
MGAERLGDGVEPDPDLRRHPAAGAGPVHGCHAGDPDADDLRAGLANRPRLITWEGGLPILHGEAIVGGIGVSGALGQEDAEYAQAGLCRLGLSSGI